MKLDNGWIQLVTSYLNRKQNKKKSSRDKKEEKLYSSDVMELMIDDANVK